MSSLVLSDRLGFCYALQHPFMRGEGGLPLLKIGATRQHPLARVRELSAATGVPGEFTLAYYHSYSDCFVAETLLHQRFNAQRVTDSREFFEVHPDEVIAYMQTLSQTTAYRDRVEASTYDNQLEENPITGGAHQRRAASVATPFADLFATFEDRGDGVLNEEECAQCRALEARR